MAFYKNTHNRTKFVVYKFLEDDRTVVVYVYEDYSLATSHVSDDKTCKYLGKFVTTIGKIREQKDWWLATLNKTNNRKCICIKIL